MKRLMGSLVLAIAVNAFGGFASSEIFLPDVGKVAGSGGSQFYTTVWVTNLGSSTANFSFELLLAGQANGSPASFADTLAAGETKMYEDVIGQTFHLASANGGARIVSTGGELFVAERIYNQPAGTPLAQTAGQFYSGIPKNFSIGSGESSSLQGVYLGSGNDFRYNYILLETSGQTCTVHVIALDDAGTQLGASDVALKPYEQLLLPAGSLASSASSTNARITATVTAGNGTVILAGSQVGNAGPQDQSGFEMSFKDSLIGGGSSGVTSLNALTGALTLAAGTGISVTPAGSTITIAYTGGGSSGLTSVVHDGTMFGLGTGSSPLGVAAPLVLTTSAGDVIVGNDTATSGSQAGVLGTTTAASGFGVHGSSSAFDSDGYLGGDDYGAFGVVTKGPGVGVLGENLASGNTGYLGGGTEAVHGEATGSEYTGVHGTSANGPGVVGGTSSTNTHDAGVTGTGPNIGVLAVSGAPTYLPLTSALMAVADHGNAVSAVCEASCVGLFAKGVSAQGVFAESDTSYGVYGNSTSSSGVWGETGGSGAGVIGKNTGSGHQGEVGTPSYGVYSIGDFGGTGAKFFVEPHATDPSKEIRYVCLEGPEAGTYFRGSSRIVNGFATIEIPDHFRMVTAETGLTVVVTPVGGLAVLAAIHQGLDKIVIQGSSDVEFNYMVNGVRKSFSDFQPISENKDFVPSSGSDTMSAAALPAESVRRLKANGILNEDGTINLETARKLGWDKQPGWKNNHEENR